MVDQHRKLAFFLPNIFTALNMACGHMAIMYSLTGEIKKACMLLILGAAFDMVDGRIARLTGTTSHFGEQFDSMSDLISFGMAPALVFYSHFFMDLGRPGILVAFIYVLCGALRLARFNANIEKVSSDYFQGIPIPGAAMAQVGLILFSLEFPFPEQFRFFPLFYLAIYALLMISTFPFPSFKHSPWVKKHKKGSLLLIFAFLICLFLYEEVTIVGFMTVYVLGSLVYYFRNREKIKELMIHNDYEHEDHA